MSDAFVGEIRPFGFPFAPLNWALCNGAVLRVTQNPALFSVIKYSFGGSGSNFALPNFLNNVMLGAGNAATGTSYPLGSTGGATSVQLGTKDTPPHTHQMLAANLRGILGNSNTPSPTTALVSAQGCTPYVPASPPPGPANMDPTALTPFGSTSVMAHNNMMPTMAITFCICTAGTMPPGVA